MNKPQLKATLQSCKIEMQMQGMDASGIDSAILEIAKREAYVQKPEAKSDIWDFLLYLFSAGEIERVKS